MLLNLYKEHLSSEALQNCIEINYLSYYGEPDWEQLSVSRFNYLQIMLLRAVAVCKNRDKQMTFIDRVMQSCIFH